MSEVKKTVKEKGYDDGAVRYSHPSYGQIRIGRQMGGVNVLYGSRLQHHDVISIQISRSVMDRHLHHDSYFAETLPIIEVHLSNVQFAEMLTNMNTQGVPCTINSFNGEHIEEPDSIETIVQSFKEELMEKTTDVRRRVKDAQSLLNNMMDSKTVKKSDVETILNKINTIECDLSSNLKFLHDTFVRAMEDGVQKAKAEFDAHVLHVAQETGIEQLRKLAPSMSEGERGVGGTKESLLISGTQKNGSHDPAEEK